jgi:hypothetical protein
MKGKKTNKIPVTSRALHQRINRKLKKDGEQLRAYRRGRGGYYVLDLERNFVVHGHVKPEQLGRRVGVLQPWERVEAEA